LFISRACASDDFPIRFPLRKKLLRGFRLGVRFLHLRFDGVAASDKKSASFSAKYQRDKNHYGEVYDGSENGRTHLAPSIPILSLLGLGVVPKHSPEAHELRGDLARIFIH